MVPLLTPMVDVGYIMAECSTTTLLRDERLLRNPSPSLVNFIFFFSLCLYKHLSKSNTVDVIIDFILSINLFISQRIKVCCQA